MKFTKLLLLAGVILLWNQAFAQISVLEKKPFTIGETVEIQSGILKEKRILNIYLPASYQDSANTDYPVIYLLDGSADEDFIHIAGLVQFGSFPWIQLIPETIVVGIANVDRQRDFTFPTTIKKDKEDYPTTGHSAAFIEFVEQELQPFIDKTYQTTTTKTLIGQSLGGLVATEILFKKPQLFDNYIIVSPSLWWDNESLLEQNLPGHSSKKSIYLAVGKEGAIMEDDAKALYNKLKSSPNAPHKLYFNFMEEQDHGDALHLAVYDAFEKMFADKNH